MIDAVRDGDVVAVADRVAVMLLLGVPEPLTVTEAVRVAVTLAVAVVVGLGVTQMGNALDQVPSAEEQDRTMVRAPLSLSAGRFPGTRLPVQPYSASTGGAVSAKTGTVTLLRVTLSSTAFAGMFVVGRTQGAQRGADVLRQPLSESGAHSAANTWAGLDAARLLKYPLRQEVQAAIGYPPLPVLAAHTASGNASATAPQSVQFMGSAGSHGVFWDAVVGVFPGRHWRVTFAPKYPPVQANLADMGTVAEAPEASAVSITVVLLTCSSTTPVGSESNTLASRAQGKQESVAAERAAGQPSRRLQVAVTDTVSALDA